MGSERLLKSDGDCRHSQNGKTGSQADNVSSKHLIDI